MDSHDNENINYIEKIINPNWIIVDVGSCDGEYVEWFTKKINSEGRIISIELYPENYENIKKRFSSSPNVEIFNYAISDIDGEIDYFLGDARWLHNIIGEDVNGKKCSPAGKIKSVTLNKLLENYDKINLIKIDTEGSELNILKGMDRVYNKIDNIIIECHNQKDWEDIKRLLLIEYKYSCFNNSSDVPNKPEISSDSDLAYQCICKKNKI